MAAEIYPGIDLVSIQRIRTVITSQHGERFLDRTYSPDEQTYCNSKGDPAMHFAGRFAAKEAIRKSVMGAGIKPLIPFKHIEVLPNDDGVPIVTIHHRLPTKYSCRVSISHDGDYATACAIFTL